MMTLIGIAGKKKVGKSLMAEHIRDLYPDRAHIVAFADALKYEVALAAGVDVKFINEHKDNFRLILQGWGTNFRRELCDKDYWVKRLWQSCVHIATTSPNAIILVPDVRFKNEAASMLNCNGVLVRIERDECDIDDQHASETELDSWTRWDATIHNNGSIDEFKQQVNETLKKLNIV